MGGRYSPQTSALVFWSRVTLRDSGCWEWTGPFSKTGYGRWSYQGEAWYAHRFAYTLMVADIPEGLWVLHRCDNPACINPAHLFVGTVTDNVHDMLEKKRERPPYRGRTHCSKGHEYTPDNTYWHKRTKHRGTWTGVERVCLKCQSARTAEWKARRARSAA